MKEYEIIYEEVNPCGGEAHSKKEILEAEAESPVAYAREHSPWPIIDVIENVDGTSATRVITGNGHGNIVRYTFTEF